jgi:hypothetical protein
MLEKIKSTTEYMNLKRNVCHFLWKFVYVKFLFSSKLKEIPVIFLTALTQQEVTSMESVSSVHHLSYVNM